MKGLTYKELTLSMIDAQAHLSSSEEIIAAAVFAAHLGYGAHTARRFVTALVMTDHLSDRSDWYEILRKIRNLQIEEQVATLNAGRPVVGDIEP